MQSPYFLKSNIIYIEFLDVRIYSVIETSN